MKRSHWNPPADVDEALQQYIQLLYPDAIAALPSGVPLIPSYEQAGNDRFASVTFYYATSSCTAYFALHKGKWVRTSDWND